MSTPGREAPLRGDGDAGELHGRGGDAARGRAERAHAERRRPRVSARRHRSGRGARSRSGCTREDSELRRRGASTTASGLPRGFSFDASKGLGLSIVQALVTGELQGSIEMRGDRRGHVERTSGCGCRWRRPRRSSCEASPSAGGALLGEPRLAELAPLLLGGAAPDARLLVGGQGELEALVVHVARGADALRRLDLLERRTGGPDGEEDVGVGVTTCRIAAASGLRPSRGS